MKKLNSLLYLVFLCFCTTLTAQDDIILYKVDSLRNHNAISLNYWLDTFSEVYKPRHFTSLDYKKKIKAGAFIARLNYVNRFNMEDYSFEIEAYPKINDKMYALVNYAGSFNNTLLPKNRFGLELFHIIFKTYEASFGYRYLKFDSRENNIYTVSLGKYYKHYWFNFRTYITTSNGSTSYSHNAIARYYFNGSPMTHLSFNIAYGTYFEQLNLGDVFGDSFGLEANSQLRLSNKLFLRLALSYRREEILFSPDDYLSRYSFKFGLKNIF
ncbi:YaiO family outer membrane beta-barrel protein [Winogradskyella sp. 3972H.M.0a.05]|uniref:YaiO family outer membrane beta-barrel protein n=1 Tax=Winogradskyella sp. 3972H.M.0a.05 TaxID=2950277 RepID=UPI003398E946